MKMVMGFSLSFFFTPFLKCSFSRGKKIHVNRSYTEGVTVIKSFRKLFFFFFFFISLFILDRHPRVGFFLPSSCDIHTMRCDIHIRSSAHVTLNDNIYSRDISYTSASNQWPTSKPYMMASSIHTYLHVYQAATYQLTT